MSESGPSFKRAHSPSSDHERNGNTGTVSPDKSLVILAVEVEPLVELKDILMADLNLLRENIERLNKVWIEAVEKNMPEEKCSNYFDKIETGELEYENKISQLEDIVQQISKLRIEGSSAKKAKIQTAVPFAKVELSHLQTMGIDIDIDGREFELPSEKQKLEPSKWLLETLGLLQKHWTTLKEAGRRTYIDAIILASIDHATRGLEEDRMSLKRPLSAFLDPKYDGIRNGIRVHGNVDYLVGCKTANLREPTPNLGGYFVALEAKVSWDEYDSLQLIAQAGAVWANRKTYFEGSSDEELSVFGVLTNLAEWEFYRIDAKGLVYCSKRLAFRYFENFEGLDQILAYLDFIIRKGVAMSPRNSRVSSGEHIEGPLSEKHTST